MSHLDTAFNRCRDYTREHAGNFYHAFRNLPPDRRRGIHALYAFCQYTDSIVDGDATHSEKRRLLAHLDEHLTVGTDGDAGTVESWLLPALRDTIERFQLPLPHLHDFLDGMKQDLSRHEFRTFRELREYAWRVASVVGLLSIEIFGYREEAVKTYAEHLGIALQLTNIIRDVRLDARHDRIYLPLEDLERFGVTREELRNGAATERYQALMRFETERAESYYRATSGLLGAADRRSMLPSEIMKNIYHRLLQKIRQHGFPLSENVIRLSYFAKIWIALRTRLSLLQPGG